MRNLKKVLSLALALVMLLGMMVIGAGAATNYTDADQISNLQAAEVADALGIIEGSGGQFMPTTELDRAQAAQIIARMMLGPDVAKTLTATNNKFVDAQGHWAAAAINYCANNGIVEGDGAVHFYPTNKVTGFQFAKMLLVALGYDAAIEGYNGSGYKQNVALDALRAGLTQNVQVSDAVLTRDAAVQMVFNALTADVMEYTLKSEGFGLITTMPNTKTDYRIVSGTVPGNSSTPAGRDKGATTMQFCELHFPQLKLVEGDGDVYGNITASWKIVKGNTSETISTTSVAYAQQYTTVVTAGKIYADLGLTATAANVPYYVDGVPTTTTISAFNPVKVGGQGAVTTVWTDEKGYPARITVVNTYVGDVAGIQANGAVTIAPRLAGETVGNVFGTTGLAVGDVVLYTKSWNSMVTAEKVTPVTGTLTAFVQRKDENRATYVNGTATLGTETAEFSEKVANDITTGVLVNSLTRTVTAVKDKYGNIIHVTENAAPGSYAFVIDHRPHPDRGDVFQAVVATETGAVQTWLVTNNPSTKDFDNNLVEYSVSGGVYTLTAATAQAIGATSAAGASASAPVTLTTKGFREVKVDGVAASAYADSSTVFIVRRGLNSFEAYHGIANVPTLSATNTGVNTAGIDAGTVVKAVYVDARTDVTFNGSMDDVIYILRQNRVEGNPAQGFYYGVYTAIVNGQINTEFRANLGLTPKTLYTYSVYNATTGITTVDVNTQGAKATGAVAVTGSVVDLGSKGGFTYNSLTKVYWVDEYGSAIYSYSIANVPKGTDDNIWYADVNGLLSLVVVEKAAANNNNNNNDEVAIPAGISNVNIATPGTVTITYDATANGGNRPTDEQIAKAIQAQLKAAGWDAPKASDFTMDSTAISVVAKKTSSSGFTTTETFTLTKATGCLVVFSIGGTAQTAVSDMTKVGDAVTGISNNDGKCYVKVLGTTPSYVLSNTTVKPGANYEASNKYYKITLAPVAKGTVTDAQLGGVTVAAALKNVAGDLYVKATDTFTIALNATTAADTSATTALIKGQLSTSGTTTISAAPNVVGGALEVVANGAKVITTAQKEIVVTFTSADAADVTVTLTLSV